MASVLTRRNILVIVVATAVIAGVVAAYALYRRHQADFERSLLDLSRTLAIARDLGAKPAANHGKNPMDAMRAAAQAEERAAAEVSLIAIQKASVVAWCLARRDGDPSRETRMAAIWFASQRSCSTEAACMARAEGKAQPIAVAPEPSSANAVAPMPTSAALQPAPVVPLDPSVCPIMLSQQ